MAEKTLTTPTLPAHPVDAYAGPLPEDQLRPGPTACTYKRAFDAGLTGAAGAHRRQTCGTMRTRRPHGRVKRMHESAVVRLPALLV